jgi:hypothetical protein
LVRPVFLCPADATLVARRLAKRERKKLSTQMETIRRAGYQLFHDFDHVGASSRHFAECMPNGRVAPFCQWVLATGSDVRAVSNVHSGEIFAKSRSENGHSLLFRDVCFHGLLLLSVYRGGFSKAAVVIACIDGVCGENVPSVSARSANLRARYVGGFAGCAAIVGDLYWALDFLGHNNYAKYQGVKLPSAALNYRWRRVRRFRYAFRECRREAEAFRDFRASPSAAARRFRASIEEWATSQAVR